MSKRHTFAKDAAYYCPPNAIIYEACTHSQKTAKSGTTATETQRTANPRATDVFFHASASFYCKRNRFYRIFVRHNELIFIWNSPTHDGIRKSDALHS